MSSMPSNPNALEQAVLHRLFEGKLPALDAFSRQAEAATVISRTFTGAGFYTKFAIPTDVAVAPTRRGTLHFGDVEAEIEGLAHGAGFVVVIEDGTLRSLEGYSYDEPWPEAVGEFTLRYTETGRESVLHLFAIDS